LKKVKGVVDAQPAGSLRRMRSTIGDLDILVAAKDSAAVMEAFTTLPRISRVLGKGETKSSIEFSSGIRAQVWVHPPEKFGTALQYATGSKDHNVQLRQLALDKGLSLSEHSFAKTNGKGEIFCATEEEVYKTLGLQWIPPELREGRDEVQLAKANKLPKLIEVKDIKSNLHMHSTYSDGKLSILDMAKAAIKRGLKVIVFSDHSVSLAVANGLSFDDHKKQAAEIKKVQKQLGDQITILHATEVEIKADGSLDYPDDFLASLDLVVASLHSSLRQPREKVTERVLNAVNNPHVDIIGHPTGREIPDREGADLDMEAIFKAAAKSGVALEINASPYRLDLDDMHARRAKELGVLITINTDAHSEEDYDMLQYGVAIARRAGLTKDDVINTWSADKLLKWLKKRG
jgi:DNA polymerase (family 10)